MGFPLLYEINTRCWLRELSHAKGLTITLGEVPDSELRFWQSCGFTHIWLMGAWTSGPRARAQALDSPGLARAFSEALPDWRPEDVSASPYAVANYRIPQALGGEVGLTGLRQRLHSLGMKVILDFVPNHLGLDHP